MRQHIILSCCFVVSISIVSGRTIGCKAESQPGKAIYTITNDQANSVIAIPISSNGMLAKGATFSTGGFGSNFLDGTSNEPAAPDALASQSALIIAGNSLFAVNAGSNTVTMFSIDPLNSTKLTMMGQPVPVLGQFPNTIAASTKYNIVCVGCSGAQSGVSCARFSKHGLESMDTLRPVGLSQTTPPVGPTNTISQVFFSNDQSTLFTTVKGDPSRNKTGFLGAYKVDSQGFVEQDGVQSSPNGTTVLFGSSTIPKSNDLFVTDASFGGVILSVDPKTRVASVKGRGVVGGQKATCWVAVSSVTGSAFVTDVGTNRLIEMSLSDASIKSTLDLSANGDPGLTDLRAAGRFVYALSPGNGTTQSAIAVVDAVLKKQVQHFALGQLGVGKSAQGMAVRL
ncbi:hypothetical protein CSIM01_06027 [Colletotrichum simmondsii]|uniref:3-carboxymuconate cyclase n=1 Tax=Colletotrichum simmondsii TaxID=703756 RepID=A0A135T436_9PEZI|nr:hypothetical protein CSIM01_06027 [Colletotrichum simmondsii]